MARKLHNVHTGTYSTVYRYDTLHDMHKVTRAWGRLDNDKALKRHKRATDRDVALLEMIVMEYGTRGRERGSCTENEQWRMTGYQRCTRKHKI